MKLSHEVSQRILERPLELEMNGEDNELDYSPQVRERLVKTI